MFGKVSNDRPHQGDILQNLQYKYITDDGETGSFTFPFWVIMSQECDLEHDFKATNGEYKDQDKCLKAILACPAFPSEQLKAGTHMQNLSLTMNTWGSDLWKKIQANKDPRFHTIVTTEIAELPNMVIDFKWCFTFPREYIYSELNNKVACLDVPYKEQLSQRFAYYLSRIPLPEELG